MSSNQLNIIQLSDFLGVLGWGAFLTFDSDSFCLSASIWKNVSTMLIFNCVFANVAIFLNIVYKSTCLATFLLIQLDR